MRKIFGSLFVPLLKILIKLKTVEFFIFFDVFTLEFVSLNIVFLSLGIDKN